MTDAGIDVQARADAQRARVEALRRRRAPRDDTPVSPAAVAGPVPSPRPRRHAAGRSRVGVAAFSVATMLGLVGVMGLARPRESAPPTTPVDTTTPPPPLAAAPAPTAAAPPAAPPAAAIAAPPLALTARPSVQVTTPPAAAPVARSNGSH